MKNKSDIVSSIIFFAMFIGILIVVKTVDVAAVGPEGTSVGLSTINKALSDSIGYSSIFYMISKVFGTISFFPVACFAILGLIQLIKRKNLVKVDRNILMLGGLYVLTFVLYIAFDKIAINYRPLLMDGETYPEPSFPSTHTLMAIVIMLSTCLNINFYIKDKKLQKIIRITAFAIMFLVVVTRFLSGVHWFTDIVASVFLGLSLVLFYSGVMGRPKRERRND